MRTPAAIRVIEKAHAIRVRVEAGEIVDKRLAAWARFIVAANPW